MSDVSPESLLAIVQQSNVRASVGVSNVSIQSGGVATGISPALGYKCRQRDRYRSTRGLCGLPGLALDHVGTQRSRAAYLVSDSDSPGSTAGHLALLSWATVSLMHALAVMTAHHHGGLWPASALRLAVGWAGRTVGRMCDVQ